MQMKLPFLENLPLKAEIWEGLDNAKRAVVIDKLAQLMTKTARKETQKEDVSHE